MRSTSLNLGAKITAVTLAAASIATAAMPGVASASGLTKKQVVALIKQYSKPGKRGKRGPAGVRGTPGLRGNTGPAGSYQVTPPLTLSAGTVGLSSTLFTRCPATEFVNVFETSGIGCQDPVTAQFATGGYSSNANTDVPNAILTSTYGRIANNPTSFNVSGTITAYINATVRVATNKATPSSPSTDQCQLYDSTTAAPLLTEDVTNGGIGNGDLQTIAAIGGNDTIQLRCEELSNDSDTAEGTLVVIPTNLVN